jgi:hypothetical protein
MFAISIPSFSIGLAFDPSFVRALVFSYCRNNFVTLIVSTSYVLSLLSSSRPVPSRPDPNDACVHADGSNSGRFAILHALAASDERLNENWKRELLNTLSSG